MAQCKVTDFYAVQKKTADLQPSKRRKVVRLNEPAILTAKKNRGKDEAAPTLVVVPSPAPQEKAKQQQQQQQQQPDFQPSKTPDINFTNNNNNEGEKVVFNAQPAPVAEEEAKPTRSTRSRKAAASKSESTSTTKSNSSKGRAPTRRGGRKKKGQSEEDDQPTKDDQQTDIRTAFQAAAPGAAAGPVEVIGEEATAHDNDHELVVTPPSSPSKLKEIQQGRKRPKKVAVVVRVTEEEAADGGGDGADGNEEEGTPRKMKKVEEEGASGDGNVTPKRTPHQMLTPSKMLTPSPRNVGCLPGSVKKLTLSSARKKLNMGGEDEPAGGVQALKEAAGPAKASPILDKARNLMKRFSESISPSASPNSSPKPEAQKEETSKVESAASSSSTPTKGKGKGKNSNRMEELKRKIKEAKEMSAEQQQDAPSGDAQPGGSSPAPRGVDNLISRLGKNNKIKEQASASSIQHGQATQAKSNKLLELQAKLKAIDKEKRALKKDIGKSESSKEAPAKPTSATTTTKAEKESTNVVLAGETANKRVPAHEKYAHLTEKVDAPGGELPLPFKYKMLLEFFRNMDQAVSLYYNRKEMITFSKLKGAVQELTRRSFDEKQLGQIMTVYPESYELRREKAKHLYGMKNLNNYELTVEPCLSGAASTCDVRPSMSSNVLLNRRHKFHHSLINIVRKHHTKFLDSLTPPVKVDEAKVQRWHPKFKLEEIPDVVVASLPAPPEVEKFSTAKEVLDKAKGSMNQRIEAALKQMAEAKKEAANKPNEMTQEKAAAVPASPSTAPPKKAATKGIPPALLAKIREKEAKKAVENLVMSGEKSERVNMLGRLPNFVKILRTFFLTEKKPALLIEDVVKKVGDSHRSALAGSAVEAHVKLIAEVAPEWLTITKLSSGTYVKINKTMDINKILDSVEKEKRRTNS